MALLAWGAWGAPLRAEAPPTFSILFWDVGLQRRGPGLLLRDLTRPGPKSADIAGVVASLVAADADVVVLDGVDYDAEGATVAALAHALGDAGLRYGHTLALRPNRGIPTGLDADRDGHAVGPGDAQGWGRYPGAGGMAVLSRRPPDTSGFWDDNGFLWRDLPENLMPDDDPPALRAVQRLATTGFYGLPLRLPGGRSVTLLMWSATPPGFDGPEDRNGRRNHDEAAFWLHLLSGDLARPAPRPPFILLGQANLDPVDGGGRAGALRRLLALPVLQDPRPRTAAPRAVSVVARQGDPALHTAHFPRLGGLRVDYILPSADLVVLDAAIRAQASQAQARIHDPVMLRVAVPP